MLLLVIGSYSFGQNLINIRHYSTADGLSDNKITNIIKDRDGFIWFASWAGLNRFDGHNFVNYKSYPGDRSSLKSNRIDDIVEDKEAGYLWVKAYDNQVYRFDKRTGTFTSVPDLLNDESLKNTLFNRILAVAKHEVWIQTVDKGVILIKDALGMHPSYVRFDNNQNKAHKIADNKIKYFHLDKYNKAWIVTSKGLSVLSTADNCDYTVKTIKAFGGISFSAMDDGGKLMWFSLGGQLYATDYQLKKTKVYKITDGIINSIKVSKSGEEIFCTTSKGEIIAVTQSGRVSVLGKMKEQSNLYSVFESTDGNLWIESEIYGAILFDFVTSKITTLYPKGKYDLKVMLSSFLIHEDENKVIWMSLNGFGLRYYDDVQRTLRKISIENELESRWFSNVIYRVFYDRSGVLWMVSDNGGIDKIVFRQYDFNQRLIKPDSKIKVDNEVRGIFSDRQNRLWIGTKGEEVFVLKGGTISENPFVSPIHFNSGIYSIFKDKNGAMWFGTKSNGLFKTIPADPEGKTYKLANHFFKESILQNTVGNSIYALMEDSKGRLWAGSFDAGLILLQNKESENKILTKENSFKNYPNGNFRRIRHLAEDGKGRIWLGTTEGLVIFDPNSSSPMNYKFKIYKKKQGDIHSLGGNDIQFIFKDSKNQMWILTSSGGLNLAIGDQPLKTLSFQNFSTKDGLPSDFLLSCTEDDNNNLWIATQNGISKFSSLNKKHQNFNQYDGLNEEVSFSEGSGVRMRNGNIVFGSTEGYLTFNPAKIHSQKTKTNLVFTNIQVNGEDIEPGKGSNLEEDLTYAKHLDLAHNQNILTINFAVLDFHSTDKLNYACRLVGFDNVWRNTEQQRKISYTNLPPGKYVFEVKSLNEELYSKIPFRSLKITIHPPFWKSWWAYSLYIIIVVALLFLAQKIIYTMLKLRHGIALEKKMVELKLNFFTQISHELRTPLTLIVNPIEEVLQNEKLTVKGKRYVNLVLKNANRMTRLVNQVLDLRKVQSGKASLKVEELELISFIQNLINYFEEVISKKELDVKIESSYQIVKAYWDIDKIEIVIYNILANAIKFSPQGGVIKIVVTDQENGEWCRIEILDDGPGVSSEELQNIFNIYFEGENQPDSNVKSSGIGLALAKELVLLHNGKIYAENNYPRGLKIVIDLKLSLNQGAFLNIGTSQTVDATKPELKDTPAKEIQPIVTPKVRLKSKNLITVLIVEDNDELRNFLADKFAENYQIETAMDGEEGMRKAIEIQPDLILSDIMMPKMDGIQMLNKLKHNSLTSHIPIILLTAKNSTENHILSLKYGADYYLPKPFDMKLLSMAMNNILLQRKNFFKAVIAGELDLDNEEDTSPLSVLTKEDKEFLDKTVQIVKEKMEDKEFNIDTVADLMNMSRSAFFKKFKSLTNLAPVEFVRDTRLEKAKEMLENGVKNVSEIAYAVGFNNPKYFSTCFKARYQTSPKEYLSKKDK